MNSQKVGSIKIPPFDKENYCLWKKKMTLFIKAANLLYMGIMDNGPFVPQKLIPESVTEIGERIPQKFVPKESSEYSDTEKDKVALDTSLQLIIVDSLDIAMLNQVINCSSAKQMWDTIELLMEGTAEVKENRLDIMTSQYEAFKSLPGENVSQVFERYKKLLNDLNLHGKLYSSREVNRKFMLTLPSHLEHKISSIRERDDINEMSIERLYGKLKTHEMEQEQRQIIYGPGTVDNKNTALLKTTTLVVRDVDETESRVEKPVSDKQEVVEADYIESTHGSDEDDFYTMEELEQLENKTMAYMAGKFKNLRFRRNPKYKFKSGSNFSGSSGSGFRGNRGGSSSGSFNRSGYKSGMVDRSKFKCYNCNEPGHFASECRERKQAKGQRETYDELKQKYEALLRKQQGKAYIAEGKSWDDSDNDDTEEYGNLALMADSTESTPTSSKVSLLSTVEMSNSYYKQTVEDLSVEMFNIHTSMLAANEENEKLALKVKMLEARNEELELACVGMLDLKHKIEYLENKDKCNKEVESALRTQLSEVEETLRAYKISANVSKVELDKKLNINKTCIGLGYEDLKRAGKKHERVDDTELVLDQNAPFVVQHVSKPIYRQFIPEPVDEGLLKIKVEMLDEDEKLKDVEKDTLPKKSVRIVTPEVKPKTEIGNNAQKKKTNRNGKVGITKKNENSSSPTATRKVCNICNSTGHLTHACKKVKVEQTEIPSMPAMPTLNNAHLPCGKVGCMLCAFNIMSAY